jgi:hypothetical protein
MAQSKVILSKGDNDSDLGSDLRLWGQIISPRGVMQPSAVLEGARQESAAGQRGKKARCGQGCLPARKRMNYPLGALRHYDPDDDRSP